MRNRMLGIVTGFAVLLGLALFGTVKAALLEGKGSLSGTVKGNDEKPVVGLALRLEMDVPIGMNPGGGTRKGKSSMGDNDARELQGKPNPNVKIVGRATTDQNGSFAMSNIDEGVYRLVAGSKAQGWIYQDVEIKSNEETKLGDLKLIKVK